MPAITVFTPTYNRAYIIEKLYRSLQSQTISDFEWLIIDDGSTDKTKELFDTWMKENNKFPIRYYKVENGGKHRAINKATDLAQGKLFFIVDSDDHLTEDALETIIRWADGIPIGEKYCGISGNRGNNIKEFIGTTFIGEYIDATSLERKLNNISGDKAEVFYTEILRRYKFEEINGENFITEATVWDRMAYDGYKIRWFNKVIYICDYLEDGLTNNLKEIFSKNPKGTAIYINQQIKFYNYNLKGRLANYHLYYDFVKNTVHLKQAAKYLGINPVTMVLAIFLFSGKRVIFKH